MRPGCTTCGDRNWRYFADCAVAFGGDALRRVSLETQHAFGAIGYAEEHEAAHHFKRVHLDTIALGGSACGAAAAGFALAGSRPGAAAAIRSRSGRQRVARSGAAVARSELVGRARKAAFDERPFSKREFDADFARDYRHDRLDRPRMADANSAARRARRWNRSPSWRRWSAPKRRAPARRSRRHALMMFGTPEQQQRYLPEILRGEAMLRHGLQRARGRLRPRRAAHARGAAMATTG